MDIGANNPNAFYETPNIDGLARKEMCFTQGYAACPVCSPIRPRCSVARSGTPRMTVSQDESGLQSAKLLGDHVAELALKLFKNP